MICYFDTSFLLAAVLGQHKQIDYEAIWNDSQERLSSHLIRIETTIAIRRIGYSLSAKDKDWAHSTITQIEPYLNAITCKYIDDSIESIITEHEEFSRCRALDAIHLATALYFQAHMSEQLSICTLDKRMRETAGMLGFTVIPEHL